jgi:hypothetical protein
MADRQKVYDPCQQGAQEKFFPVCKIGQILIFVGLGLAFLSFIFGFGMAFLGAILILVGYVVVRTA